jgi:hypothetical protein
MKYLECLLMCVLAGSITIVVFSILFWFDNEITYFKRNKRVSALERQWKIMRDSLK